MRYGLPKLVACNANPTNSSPCSIMNQMILIFPWRNINYRLIELTSSFLDGSETNFWNHHLLSLHRIWHIPYFSPPKIYAVRELLIEYWPHHAMFLGFSVNTKAGSYLSCMTLRSMYHSQWWASTLSSTHLCHFTTLRIFTPYEYTMPYNPPCKLGVL